MFNYHTHTYRCKHASGDTQEYAAHALKAGLCSLGMSDHTPFPDHRWTENVRMEWEELPDYFASIDKAQAAFPELNIFRALECEYDPKLESFYTEIKQQWNLDYMIGAVHWIPHEGEWINFNKNLGLPHLVSYTKNLIQAMESGHFLFMAHPDNWASWSLPWNEEVKACCRDVFSTALRLKIPLEINGYGYRKKMVMGERGLRPPYPWRPYWEMAAQYGVSVLYNSDAHKPSDVYASADQGLALIRDIGLNAVDPLKGKVPKNV